MLINYYDTITKNIDSCLEFVKAPWEFNKEGFVFRIRRKGIDRILKGCNAPMDLWIHQDEEAALKRAEHIEGITHLVHCYGWIGGWYAFLKEYASGERFDKVDSKKIKGKGLKRKLAETIGKLHLVGVSGIEIVPRNIIVSPEYDKLTIIDFNKTIVNKGYNLPSFVIGVAFDKV